MGCEQSCAAGAGAENRRTVVVEDQKPVSEKPVSDQKAMERLLLELDTK